MPAAAVVSVGFVKRRDVVNYLVPAVDFLHDDKGATAVEYSFMAAMIAGAVIVIVYFIGLQVKDAFGGVCNSLRNVSNIGICN